MTAFLRALFAQAAPRKATKGREVPSADSLAAAEDHRVMRDALRRGPRFPVSVEQSADFQRLSERRRRQPGLMGAERTRYLAEGALEAEQEAQARTGLPLVTERALAGVSVQGVEGPAGIREGAGRARYSERPRSWDEISEDAARAAGVPASYIRHLMGHESGDDPSASAPTSSADGLGQFIDRSWRERMSRSGARYGLGEGDMANLSDEEIMALRRNPAWAAVMIGEEARDLEDGLRRRLGRTVTEGEVYLAHFLGEGGASRLLRAPRAGLARDHADQGQVNANLPIFYTREARFDLVPDANGKRKFRYLGGGRLRTVQEVIEAQTGGFSRAEFRSEPRD